MIIEQLYRRVLIPGFESVVKRRKTFAYWRELEQSQWESLDQLRQRQIESLRRLLVHSSANCPYYRDKWKSLRLDPLSVRSLNDFQSWPFTSRETIRSNRMAMRCVSPNRPLIAKTTGGSSGVPLEFDLDTESYERRFAAYFRGYGWAGASPGTRQWSLWGASLSNASRASKWKDWLYHALYRRRIANCFHLSEETVPSYFADLNRFRPDCIIAYTSPLYTFARVLEERGLRPFSPRSIIVGAEKLHGFQRELIERVFQAPLFETYGSREFMLIGGECDRHCGLHMTMENLIVEIVDDKGNPTPEGEEGNVVITDLTNYGMPFIRYPNGDRAVVSPKACPCGRGLPLLEKIVGRRLDMLETPDERHVPGEFIVYALLEFQCVRRYQAVQESLDSIQIRIVVNREWNEQWREKLIYKLRDALGKAVRLDLVVVDDIPLTAVGKHQVVINRLPGRAFIPHQHSEELRF
jgi:phenylacetate-CoA ligase